MASFPTSIVSPTDPTSGNFLSSPSHSQEHQSHNAEIVAVETKVGTGASTPTASKVLRGTGTGTSGWAQLVLSTDVATATSADLRGILSDETGTGVAVFGTTPTIATPNITTPTITTGGAWSGSPVLTTPQIVTSINDTNGNEVIKTPATSSAVNEVTVTNAATGNAPSISATGNDSASHLNLRGKGLAKTVTIGAGAVNIFPYDYVASGCVWTADAAGSTRLASCTAGVVVINGNPLTVAAVTSRTFTASKDVYDDLLDNGDGTAIHVYTDGTTNAVSGALAANSIRNGIIVVGATNIAAAASINQGQEDRVLPIASSIPYSVTDSLGNLICPRDPNRKLLGLRAILSDFSTASTTQTQVTGLSVPVIVPVNRKIKITITGDTNTNSSAAQTNNLQIWDGVVPSGTSVGTSRTGLTAAGGFNVTYCEAITTPASTSKTYNAGLSVSGASTATLSAGTSRPCAIKVELE